MTLSGPQLVNKIHEACCDRYVALLGKQPTTEDSSAWKPTEERIFQIMKEKQIEIQNFQHEFLKALRQVSREIEHSYRHLDEAEKCQYPFFKHLLFFIAICTLARL